MTTVTCKKCNFSWNNILDDIICNHCGTEINSFFEIPPDDSEFNRLCYQFEGSVPTLDTYIDEPLMKDDNDIIIENVDEIFY